MDKPTLSPQSNRLLEMCQGVLDGNNDPAELSTLLDEMYESLDKARNEFESQVEKQGEEYSSKMQDVMELVLMAFDDYYDALEKISSYFSGYNPENITAGMEMTIRATGAILDTLTVYEAKSLQMGPTSFPILNMLILMCDAFKKGDLPSDEFRAYVFNASQYFEKLIEEGENYKGEEARNSINTLVEGYKKFVAGLEKLDEAAESNNELLMDDALEIIHGSQEIIRSGYESFNQEMFLGGPTVSPFANQLISAVNGVRKGTFPKELLKGTVEAFRDHMDELRKSIEQAHGVNLENNLTNQIEKTMEALEMSDEACELIGQFMGDGNFGHLEPAIEKIKVSTEMLKEAQEGFEKIVDDEGKIACVRCGNMNSPSGNACSKCGAILPRTGGLEGSSTFSLGEEGEVGYGEEGGLVMTETLARLIQACADIRDEKISEEEFLQVVNSQERDLRQLLTDLEKPPVSLNPEDYPEEVRSSIAEQLELGRDIIDLTREGGDAYLEGIHEIKLFLEDGDVEHLRKGIESTVSGNQMLHQVRKFGEISKRELAKYEAATASSKGEKGAKPADKAKDHEETGEDSMDSCDSCDSCDGYVSDDFSSTGVIG